MSARSKVVILIAALVAVIVIAFFLTSFIRDVGYKSVTMSDLVNNTSVGDKVSFTPIRYGIGNVFSCPSCGLGGNPTTPTAEDIARQKKLDLLVTVYTDNSYNQSVLLDFTVIGNKFDDNKVHLTIYGTVTTIGTNSVDVVVDYYK
jgi:hypothetical protein